MLQKSKASRMEAGVTDQKNNSTRASTQEGPYLKVVLPSLKGSGGEDGWGGVSGS